MSADDGVMFERARTLIDRDRDRRIVSDLTIAQAIIDEALDGGSSPSEDVRVLRLGRALAPFAKLADENDGARYTDLVEVSAAWLFAARDALAEAGL